MSYGVVDFTLLIAVIPDASTRTRDVAFCSGMGALADAIGKAISGSVLAAAGHADTHVPPGRPHYDRSGYMTIWMFWGTLNLLSIPMIWTVRAYSKLGCGVTSAEPALLRREEEVAEGEACAGAAGASHGINAAPPPSASLDAPAAPGSTSTRRASGERQEAEDEAQERNV